MAYFDAEGLKYQDGTLVELPYATLRDACLAYDGENLRISSIIFQMLEYLLGEPLVRNATYSKNMLYRKLEEAIQKDPKYIARKKKYQVIYKETLDKSKRQNKVTSLVCEVGNSRRLRAAKTMMSDRTRGKGGLSSGLGFYPKCN